MKTWIPYNAADENAEHDEWRIASSDPTDAPIFCLCRKDAEQTAQLLNELEEFDAGIPEAEQRLLHLLCLRPWGHA